MISRIRVRTATNLIITFLSFGYCLIAIILGISDFQNRIIDKIDYQKTTLNYLYRMTKNSLLNGDSSKFELALTNIMADLKMNRITVKYFHLSNNNVITLSRSNNDIDRSECLEEGKWSKVFSLGMNCVKYKHLFQFDSSKQSILELIIETDLEEMQSSIVGSFSNLFIIVLLFFALSVILGFLLKRYLFDPVVNIGRNLNDLDAKDLYKPIASSQHAFLEIVEIERSITDYISKIIELEKSIKENEIDKARSDLASQVAHDIRSPLAALDMATKTTTNGSGFNEIVFNSAINRIRDLANELLKSNKKKNASHESLIEKVSICSMASTIVSEKRLEYSSLDNVNIQFNILENGHTSFCQIKKKEILRVLSNLINNSIEARCSKGINIDVTVSSSESTVNLIIKDNGKGIPTEYLEKVFERGKSVGKTSGNGLGLSHAKETVETFRGSFNLESSVGIGTTITITLPKSEPPETFASVIDIDKDSQIVLIDDDYSIHEVWKSKIGNSILYFKKPESFIEWYDANKNNELTLIVDYEFKNSKLNGLDIVKKIEVRKNVYLSTSHYSHKNIQDSCRDLGIKLVDKSLIPYIPIQFKNKEIKKTQTILIDDDPLVRMVWDMRAKEKGIDFKSYSNRDEFYSNLNSLSKDSPIYVDSCLGEGINGEDIVNDLLVSGYQKVALATGYTKDKFPGLSAKIEIRGKEAPW